MNRLLFTFIVFFMTGVFSSGGYAASPLVVQDQKGKVISVWQSIQSRNLEKFEADCKNNQHPICVLGGFVLGKSDAKTFLIKSRLEKQVIVSALSDDQAIAQFYYRNKQSNPLGAGYVFSILDLVSSLSDIYPRESFVTLLTWYRASEGEYAEYAQEQLRIFLKKQLNSELRKELQKKYGKELLEIEAQ